MIFTNFNYKEMEEYGLVNPTPGIVLDVLHQ